MTDSIHFDAILDRHQSDLPVFAMVPVEVPEAFGKSRTFVVEAQINGRPIGRRSIKPWGDGRWFLELTKAHCKALGVDMGANLSVDVALAPETPDDLRRRIDQSGLAVAWAGLSEVRRRSLAEPVFGAKRPATRAARIDRIVSVLSAG